MADVKDYTSDEKGQYTHYNGVPSFYGKIVDEQCRKQPDYCDPGMPGGDMRGDKRNTQKGP